MGMNTFKFLLLFSNLYGCIDVVVSLSIPFKVCTAIGYIGVKYPKDFETQSLGAGSGINQTYLLVDPDGTFPCCGVIEEWDAYVLTGGTIVFEIWRPTSGIAYKRVGYNSATVAGRTEIPLAVQPGARHTVYPGDNIGWYTTTANMLAYRNGVGGEITTVKYFTQPLMPPDIIIDSNTAATDNTSVYAIRARYGINAAPRFLNLDADITVSPPIPIGKLIYTVYATDDDISDTTITQLMYNCSTKSNYFTFNNTTQEVTVIANLSSKVGYECLTFTVQDICQNTDTGRLCITIHNDPPSVACIPQTASVVESTSGNTNITTLNVSDSNDDVVTCSLLGTSPSGSQFRLQQDSGAYIIYTNANPNFRVAANDKYSIYISCTDGKTSTSVICGVKIVPSQRPTIINLPNSVSLNTLNVKSYEFFNVNVSDPDSVNFTYSMTCVPTKCPFTITNAGAIQLTQNLENHTIERYNFFITVTDGYNTVINTLNVTISGINYAPVLTNLPLAYKLTVQENTAIGTSLYQVTAADKNNDSLVYSVVSLPVNGTDYFSIDSSNSANMGTLESLPAPSNGSMALSRGLTIILATMYNLSCTKNDVNYYNNSNTYGIISTIGELDFEKMTFKSFTLTVSVTDGKLSASGTLVVQVLDVNERPSFEQSAYTIQANESVAGTRLPDPRFNVSESDAGDYVKFSHDCGVYTSYIRMDPNNGLLTFAEDYDLDGTGNPTLINCTVKATDKGGLTATANLSIIINETNDHRPIFMYPSYTFYAYNDSTVGLLLGNISATDADIGTNGMFNFSSNQNGLSKVYFDVSSTGQVTLLSNLSGVLGGAKLQFTVLVTDFGSPPLYGSAQVTVIILEGSTTSAPVTTARYKTFLRDEGNIAWFSLALLTGLIVMVITTFICVRYICEWPSNFDPLKTCTTELRKLNFCKDSRINRNAEPQPNISSRRKIMRPRSPPRKRPPRAMMRSSPTPSVSAMITPHTNSGQMREETMDDTSVQMWFSPTPPMTSMMISPQATNTQMRAMITEPRR